MEPDDSPPLQGNSQVLSAEHEQNLSPALETMLAGIITVKTLQKPVQSRQPSANTACSPTTSTGVDLPFHLAFLWGIGTGWHHVLQRLITVSWSWRSCSHNRCERRSNVRPGHARRKLSQNFLHPGRQLLMRYTNVAGSVKPSPQSGFCRQACACVHMSCRSAVRRAATELHMLLQADIHTVPLHMPLASEFGHDSCQAYTTATCSAPVPLTCTNPRLLANHTQRCPGTSDGAMQPENFFPSAAHALAQEPAIGGVLGAGIDTSIPSLCFKTAAQASVPPGPTPNHAITMAASVLARVQMPPPANRSRSRQRRRFQRPLSTEAVRLNLQPTVLPRAFSPSRQEQAAVCAIAHPASKTCTPCGPLLHDSAVMRVEKPLGACIGHSLQRGVPRLGATPCPRTSSVAQTAPSRGRSPRRRQPKSRQKLGWADAASTVPPQTCQGVRRPVSAPAEPQCMAWQEDELEVTGRAPSVGINLVGHVAGAGHTSPSPDSRPRTQDCALPKMECLGVVERISPHHVVIPVSEATLDSLLVVCDDEAAVGRSRSAHRTRKAETWPTDAVGECPTAGANKSQACEQRVCDVLGQQSRAHIVEGLKQRSSRALGGGLGQAEGGCAVKRSVSAGCTTAGRPVTAPGYIHTGRAPLTKLWASRDVRDEGFAAAGAQMQASHPHALVPRVHLPRAAEGQFALQLNVQAAHAFERVARQSTPVVVCGVGKRIVR